MLLILDGWGIGALNDTNAIYMAKMPFLDQLKKDYPATRLSCSGKAVGLPDKIMGNSEVGHLNIGAGRIVYQGLMRIDMAIKDGSFFDNDALSTVMSTVIKRQSALHLMGLVSDAGVHSQLSHLFALIEMAAKKGVTKIYIHVILDGRDTPPDSGVGYVSELQKFLDLKKTGAIASMCGRYYAMDRDTRWDRTQKAYQLYTTGDGICETDPVVAVKNAYNRDETDEFVKPVIIVDEKGAPLKIVSDKDGIIFFNFRPDRARQITRAFTDPDFDHFQRKKTPALCDFVCMSLYDESFTLPVAFRPVHINNVLGEVVSRQGLNQLRIAETEKYAHVTYFFNGGEEKAFPNEDRHLVPSPRDVDTYDKKPEMSAYEVAEKTVSFIDSEKYQMIVLNFANLDMVGHTGDIEAAVKAGNAVDQCVEQVVTAALKKGGTVLVTADHGNAEKMKEDNGQIHTAHTLNQVPLVLVSKEKKTVRLREGVLGDIAPTMLEIMDIEKPVEMTGTSLIVSE